MSAENCGACGTDSACLECRACDLYDERALHREVVRALTAEIARLSGEYARGYREGVEAAASLCDNDNDQHLRGLFRNRKILAKEIRALSSPPSPTSAETAKEVPKFWSGVYTRRIDGKSCPCGAAPWRKHDRTLACEETAPPPEVERGKCGECEGSGRVWFEGASRPCDTCGTGREGTK